MGSHHSCAELLHEGVHITMDIIAVRSGRGEVCEGARGLSEEGLQIQRRSYPVAQTDLTYLSATRRADRCLQVSIHPRCDQGCTALANNVLLLADAVGTFVH